MLLKTWGPHVKEEMPTKVWLEDKGRNYVEDLQEKEIIIKWNFKGTGCKDVHWIELAKDMDEWQISVNMVLNVQVL
jgi:hypothetical protein